MLASMPGLARDAGRIYPARLYGSYLFFPNS